MEKTKSDSDIASRVQNGDREAFSCLVSRYEERMGRYAGKFLWAYDDKQDAVQDVFIKAYMNIKGYDTTRSFSTWLYRVAHNTFIDFIRKRGRERVLSFGIDMFFAPAASSDESDIERFSKMEAFKELDEKVSVLPPKYREPLVLHYFEERTYEEISEILRMPIGTVGIRISRARALLRKLYEG